MHIKTTSSGAVWNKDTFGKIKKKHAIVCILDPICCCAQPKFSSLGWPQHFVEVATVLAT